VSKMMTRSGSMALLLFSVGSFLLLRLACG
jgi:hypothetical protein